MMLFYSCPNEKDYCNGGFKGLIFSAFSATIPCHSPSLTEEQKDQRIRQLEEVAAELSMEVIQLKKRVGFIDG
jgi:hypothetical protein